MTKSKSCASKQVRNEEKMEQELDYSFYLGSDKDKLRLAICMSQSKWAGLIYNTKEYYEEFDSMLKEIDEEYRTTLINFGKYKLVMFVIAKLMEMETTEQNHVAIYVFNKLQKIKN